VCDFRRSVNLDIGLNLAKFFRTSVSFTTNLDQEYVIGNYFHLILKGFSLNLGIEQRNGFIKSAQGLSFKLYLDQSF